MIFFHVHRDVCLSAYLLTQMLHNLTLRHWFISILGHLLFLLSKSGSCLCNFGEYNSYILSLCKATFAKPLADLHDSKHFIHGGRANAKT